MSARTPQFPPGWLILHEYDMKQRRNFRHELRTVDNVVVAMTPDEDRAEWIQGAEKEGA